MTELLARASGLLGSAQFDPQQLLVDIADVLSNIDKAQAIGGTCDNELDAFLRLMGS